MACVTAFELRAELGRADRDVLFVRDVPVRTERCEWTLLNDNLIQFNSIQYNPDQINTVWSNSVQLNLISFYT